MIKKIAKIIACTLVIALLGVWLILIPWALGRPLRQPLATTPASLGLNYEDVSFPAKGGDLTIRAWWMPAKNARAVLINVHGANANRVNAPAHGLELSKLFVEQGISVLAPDLRNHGLSDPSPNGRLTMGYYESKDVIGAIDWATAREPNLPIYLMGASLGGAAVIYAASDPRVKLVVLFDPVLNPHQTTLNMMHLILPLPQWMLVPVVWSSETFFPMDAMRHDPLKAAETLTMPTLLIQDDADHICPVGYAQELAGNNRAVTLWVSHDPDATKPNHAAAFRLHPDEVKQQISAFLAAHEQPAAGQP